MLVTIHTATKSILNLPRFAKNIIAIIVDLNLCVLSTWFAFYLSLDQFILIQGVALTAVMVSVALALPIFWILGLYRTIFRYSGLSITFSVSIALLIYGFLYFSVFGVYGVAGIPRSIGILQPMLLFFAVVSSRLFVKYLFGGNYLFKDKSQLLKKTLVYGAGSAGRQLVSALANSNELKVVGFLDDDGRLHGQVLQGQEIYPPLKIADLIKSKEVQLILLALPSISRSRRNEILKNLSNYPLQVQTLPTVADIIQGRVNLSDIKDLDVDDILNRDQVLPNTELLLKNITSKVVLVTGAGGSIGSELCRQIIKFNPKMLVCLDISEIALYKIEQEFLNLKFTNNIFVVADVKNKERLKEIFHQFKPEIVFHAAAYKHVPLMETYNVSEALINNAIGTYHLALIAKDFKVNKFILVSTDKAVNPTNVMGASKHLAEIICLGLQSRSKTDFVITRFGNVLGSSGSVIPKFREQIALGGPVTITHPQMTRYFMSIPEAAQLVMQASLMGKSGQIYILDMGESVKIVDLAKDMIKLSGFDEDDIKIKFTGLRPGEKLYEELLSEGEVIIPTTHPKLKIASSENISERRVKDLIKWVFNI